MERLAVTFEWHVRQRSAPPTFLSDTTTGLAGGKLYFRSGMLGYNNMDKRYEWTTADNQTPIMMSYYSAKGSGTSGPINMAGSFTDPGVTGDKNVGRTIRMRTTIRIVSSDRHIYQIFFTPPGKPEMLADRMIFDRIK